MGCKLGGANYLWFFAKHDLPNRTFVIALSSANGMNSKLLSTCSFFTNRWNRLVSDAGFAGCGTFNPIALNCALRPITMPATIIANTTTWFWLACGIICLSFLLIFEYTFILSVVGFPFCILENYPRLTSFVNFYSPPLMGCPVEK